MSDEMTKGFSRRLGFGVRIVAAMVGVLGIIASTFLCFISLPGGLAALALSVALLFVGISGNPRSWLTWGGTGDPEWEADIVDGSSPGPKYIKYTWMDYALLAGMILSGLLLLPLWNKLDSLDLVDVRWKDAALVLSGCILFNAYWWQVKSSQLDGIWISLITLSLGLVIITMGIYWHPLWMPTLGAAIIYCSSWSALRKCLIAALHVKHRDADR